MTSLSELVQLIKDEAAEISQKHEDRRPSLYSLFRGAIDKTMVEIKMGANSDDFPDLVVINMIIASANEDYTDKEIKAFVDKLSEKKDLALNDEA